jgi:hypothetical protein
MINRIYHHRMFQNQMFQGNKGLFNKRQLILLCLLLPLSSVCLSDNAVPEIQKPTEPQPISEMGEQNDGTVKEKPKIEDLGNDQYRVGAIKIDKVKRLMTVPGVMLPYEEGKAIEFMAAMKRGYKSYESVLSLDVNAFEFNLACILIGLDSSKSVLPKFHFDPAPVKGDPVSITVSWEKNGKKVEHDVIDLLNTGETKPEKPSVWSYTGSMFVDGNRYLAQMDGVLIGLIHDPSSIIEHKKGVGVGGWGSVTVNPDVAPEAGQKVVVNIRGLD